MYDPNVKILPYQYNNLYHKGSRISRPPYLYNNKFYAQSGGLDIEKYISSLWVR